MAVIEAIATQYLEVDVATVTFSSIPSTYEHLQLRYTAGEDNTGSEAALGMRFNGDSGTNYAFHRLQGSSTTPSHASSVNQNAIYLYYCVSYSDSVMAHGATILDILDYRNTNKNTTIQAMMGNVADPAVSANRVVIESAFWNNTAAVTSITLVPGWGSNIVRGSGFTLYGIKSS